MKTVSFAIITSSLLYVSALFASSHQGFLTPETVPNSLTILPPPPLESSVSFLNDKANYEVGKTVKDRERVALAVSDADYKNITVIFSTAFGKEISPSNTPQLYALLQSVLQDSHDYAMRNAKDYYIQE